MHIAESPMLDQYVVEQPSCGGEIELFERARARFLHRQGGTDHMPGVIVERCAIEIQASCLGILSTQLRHSAKHQQRECLTSPVTDGFREGLCAKGQRLE